MVACRYVSGVMLVAALVFGNPSQVQARGEGGGDIGKGKVITWVTVRADGSYSAPVGFNLRYSFEGADPACSTDEGRWREWLFFGDDPAFGQLTGDDIFILIPGDDGIGIIGASAELELINPGPNQGDVTRPYCGSPPVADLDVWDAAAKSLPAPNLSLNPSPIIDGQPTGVTGMEIWLWFDPGAPGWEPPETTISVTASAGGFSTRVDAWVAAVRWSFDNGDSESIGFVSPGTRGAPTVDYYRSISGSESDPAQKYTYRTKGLYSLAIEVIWTGRFELFDAGGASLGVYPLDPYTDAETIGYQVIEIRSVLTP